MRKFIIRIFNIIYLAGAVLAISMFTTKPLLDAKVTLNIKKDQLRCYLPSVSQTKSKSSSPFIMKDGSSTETDILNKITPDRMANAIGDISLPLEVKIPVKYCFDLKNKQVINNIVTENVDYIVDTLSGIMVPKIKAVIKDVALEVASDIITDQIANQIDKYFEGNEEDKPPVDQEQVEQIVNNVYELFDKPQGETTTVDELSEVLLGSQDYTVADPQPTAETFGNGKYYVTADQGETFTAAETYTQGTTYYVAPSGVLGVLADLNDQGIEGFECDLDTVNTDSLNDALVEALDSMPGLTEKEYKLADPQPTSETFADGKYFITADEGKTYTEATQYETGVEYYAEETIITNIDDALIGLMNFFVGKTSDSDENGNGEGEQTSMIVRSSMPKRSETNNEGESSSLSKAVADMIKEMLPLDRITSKDLSFGGFAPYILFASVALCIFPWALFALVTFIRLLRPRKCWTKPWIVFVFAFPQILSGVVLTKGLSYLIDALKNVSFPQGFITITDVLFNSSIEIVSNSYIPSLIYIAMIPMTIIYIIICHRTKTEYKIFKRFSRHNGQYYQCNNQVPYNYSSSNNNGSYNY